MNPLDHMTALKGLVNSEDGISILAGAAALLVAIAVVSALRPRNPLAARMRSIGPRREALKAGLMAPRRRGHRVEAVSAMRTVIKKLKLLRSHHAEETQRRLMLAGLRSSDAVVVFLFFKLFLPLASGVAAVIAFYWFGLYGLEPIMRLAASMAAVVAGAYLPELFVRNLAAKRRQKIVRGLPDALDLMVICAEAGLGLEAALHRVSHEIAPNAPELADELNLTAIELGFLAERRVALENLTRRTDLPSIRGVVNALVQTERYGTPLAGSLRVLASEYRDERMMKAEEKAAKLPATLTIPMIVFILPTLFIVLLVPAVFRAVDGLSGVSF